MPGAQVGVSRAWPPAPGFLGLAPVPRPPAGPACAHPQPGRPWSSHTPPPLAPSPSSSSPSSQEPGAETAPRGAGYLRGAGPQRGQVLPCDLLPHPQSQPCRQDSEQNSKDNSPASKGRGPAPLQDPGRAAEWRSSGDSLRRRQMTATAWKRGWEKLARRRRAQRLGSRRMTGRCWGPKKRRASARIPYLSSVQWVCNSHCLFCSHQMAWSDQSCLRSAGPQEGRGTRQPRRALPPNAEHKPRIQRPVVASPPLSKPRAGPGRVGLGSRTKVTVECPFAG